MKNLIENKIKLLKEELKLEEQRFLNKRETIFSKTTMLKAMIAEAEAEAEAVEKEF